MNEQYTRCRCTYTYNRSTIYKFMARSRSFMLEERTPTHTCIQFSSIKHIESARRSDQRKALSLSLRALTRMAQRKVLSTLIFRVIDRQRKQLLLCSTSCVSFFRCHNRRRRRRRRANVRFRQSESCLSSGTQHANQSTKR